jgi:hypothetical protein
MQSDRFTMNEHRQLVFGAEGGPIVFLCECGDPDGFGSVQLTRVEYAALRPGPILAPGHSPSVQPTRREQTP